MADVTGPISTLPGHRRNAPADARCDEHPDRPAVARVQGETDSFGSEQHDLCQECIDEMRREIAAEKIGMCDWCKLEAMDLRPRRDFEEGMHGRVYRVCGACVRREYASKHQFCEASVPAGDLAEAWSLLDVAVTSVCTGFDLPDDWLQRAAAAVGRPLGKDFKPTPKREAPCRWTQMDQGGSTYNTCATRESFRLEPGCDPWPHCHWCGKPVVLVPWEEWGNDDDEF